MQHMAIFLINKCPILNTLFSLPPKIFHFFIRNSYPQPIFQKIKIIKLYPFIIILFLLSRFLLRPNLFCLFVSPYSLVVITWYVWNPILCLRLKSRSIALCMEISISMFEFIYFLMFFDFDFCFFQH